VKRHSNWATNLFAVLQGQAADVRNGVPTEGTYERIIEALGSHCGDHQLSGAYRSQLKAKTQLVGKSLQEFGAATEQLAYAFVDGIRDRDMKQWLLMGGDRTLSEALNQALQVEAAKRAAGTFVRLRQVRDRMRCQWLAVSHQSGVGKSQSVVGR
jgi:hypothetical protein